MATGDTSGESARNKVPESEANNKSRDSVLQRSIKKSFSLFGTPYQFLDSVDPRSDGGIENGISLGVKFIENVISEAPIVYFIPGKLNYIPESSSSEQASVGEAVASGLNDVIGGSLDDTRYFDFDTQYTEYMSYVNMLCNAASSLMDIGGVSVPGHGGTTYSSFDWTKYQTQTGGGSSGGRYESVQFYADVSTSFSEQISNNLTSSKITSIFETAQGLGREVDFLTDYLGVDEQKITQNFGSAMTHLGEGLNDIVSGIPVLGSVGKLIERLTATGGNILKGANVMFPEIWENSRYDKSYNISINLVSPYGDKESVFINCIAPLLHLLALALPRQVSANAYSNPFFIKAYALGLWSCEVGIVNSITITKVNESYSVDGLPTEIKVDMGIQDLYSSLMMSNKDQVKLFYENNGMMDFLLTLCGVDVNEPSAEKKANLAKTIAAGKLTSKPAYYASVIKEEIANFTNGWLNLGSFR